MRNRHGFPVTEERQLELFDEEVDEDTPFLKVVRLLLVMAVLAACLLLWFVPSAAKADGGYFIQGEIGASYYPL